MAKNATRVIVRRVPSQPQPDAGPAMTHEQAFAAAHGERTYALRHGAIRQKSTDTAAERAAACIEACDGLDLAGLKANGIRDLVEAARSARRLLIGPLVRVDPQADVVRRQVESALHKLGMK